VALFPRGRSPPATNTRWSTGRRLTATISGN
jgi:hypothetical protein